MSASPLSRHAGLIVLTVGAYLTVTHLALLAVVDGDNPAAMLADPLFRVVNVAYAAAFPALAIALCAAYDRQARAAGMFGLIAFGAAMVGTVTLGADMWFEGFAAPWLAEVEPEVLTAEKTAIWSAGFLSSFVLFAVGWVLFGLASLSARVYPRPVGYAIVAGGLIGFKAAAPPYGAFLGLALLGLGIWLVRVRLATCRDRRNSARLGSTRQAW
jgi:hypothetical protein